MGEAGAGHFVKMVHNGIEYGMMQAYAEGFEVLYKAEYKLDLESVAKVWNHGSVIRSWLLELGEESAGQGRDAEIGGPPTWPTAAKAAGRCRRRMDVDVPVPCARGQPVCPVRQPGSIQLHRPIQRGVAKSVRRTRDQKCAVRRPPYWPTMAQCKSSRRCRPGSIDLARAFLPLLSNLGQGRGGGGFGCRKPSGG